MPQRCQLDLLIDREMCSSMQLPVATHALWLQDRILTEELMLSELADPLVLADNRNLPFEYDEHVRSRRS